MNSTPGCNAMALFPTATAASSNPLVLELKGIPVESDKAKPGSPPNFHVPSMKNNKVWMTKLPNGKPLQRPMLITKPSYQKWMQQAVASLVSQCISACRTGSGATPPAPSKLSAMLSRLPSDDSVNDFQEIHLTVERVNPGQEGALIILKRLN